MTHDRPRSQPDPKTRPVDHKRTALVASLDVGTSKIACMIARLKPSPANDALRGRTHAVELIGYSQIQSRGVKAGSVVDLAECEQAVRQAVALAERMAKVRVESVLLSVSGGRLQGQLVEAAADIRGGAVTAGVTGDLHRHAPRHRRGAHGAARASRRLRAGWRQGHPRPPRHGGPAVRRRHERGDGDATVARNLMLVVERCHLNVGPWRRVLMSQACPC